MGLFDNIRNALKKNAQNTHIDFNKAIYNYLGENLIRQLKMMIHISTTVTEKTRRFIQS